MEKLRPKMALLKKDAQKTLKNPYLKPNSKRIQYAKNLLWLIDEFEILWSKGSSFYESTPGPLDIVSETLGPTPPPSIW